MDDHDHVVGLVRALDYRARQHAQRAQDLSPQRTLHNGVLAAIAQCDSENSDQPIKSGGASWFARPFMKSHFQIEDIPRIWQQAAPLTDGQFAQPAETNSGQVRSDCRT